MRELERKRRRKKTEHFVKMTAFLMLVLFIGAGSYTYAKYFSESARYGVAIASGVYFSANYASETSSDSDEYFECVVTTSYSGGNYSFTFDVRNYENNILFNESGVVIPYSISFWLGEAPENATYKVSWQEAGETKAATLGVDEKNKVIISDQSIEGGSARVVEYTIAINAQDSEEVHSPVPIYAEVWTQEGAIISKTLHGKMVLYNMEMPENYIESQEFVVSDEYEDDAALYALIQKQSMLTYEIRTVGEVAASDVTELLKLSWDPAILEIDLFDEAYVAWQESNAAEGGSRPQTPAVDSETGWYYITLEVMPYSAQTVGFFRGTGFENSIEGCASAEDSMAALRAAIVAEKYSETE